MVNASVALWQELTYERRQALFDNQDVWVIDADEYRVQYKRIFSSATAQQVMRTASLIPRDLAPGPRPSRGDRWDVVAQGSVAGEWILLS